MYLHPETWRCHFTIICMQFLLYILKRFVYGICFSVCDIKRPWRLHIIVFVNFSESLGFHFQSLAGSSYVFISIKNTMSQFKTTFLQREVALVFPGSQEEKTRLRSFELYSGLSQSEWHLRLLVCKRYKDTGGTQWALSGLLK